MKTNQTLNTNQAGNAPDTLKMLREFYLQYCKKCRFQTSPASHANLISYQQQIDAFRFKSAAQ